MRNVSVLNELFLRSTKMEKSRFAGALFLYAQIDWAFEGVTDLSDLNVSKTLFFFEL